MKRHSQTGSADTAVVDVTVLCKTSEAYYQTCAADLMEVMKGSGQGLMQQVASTVAAAQVSRANQTVGTRFRDQLKDLIARLDQYVAAGLICVAMHSTYNAKQDFVSCIVCC